jgi:hypothetical protein
VNSRTHLVEHCGRCTDGVIYVDGVPVACGDCNGTTRRRRGTHDPRSSIDYDPNEHAETCATRYPRGPGLGLGPCDCSRELMDHVRHLVRAHLNDSGLGAAVRALLNAAP